MRLYVHDSEGKRLVEADEDASLIDAVGAQGESQIWEEDANEPLARGAKVGVLAGREVAAVHVGKGQITVAVTYNGVKASTSFGPGTKIDKVLDWALANQAFNIPVGDRDDLVLRLSGSTEPLDPDTHIGTLVSAADRLSLDLVPGERFAG
jgi:hypothetical protein